MMATVFQEGQSSFSGLGMRFRISDSRITENIDFLPTIEYWRNSSKLESFGLASVRRDGTIGADVRWLFPGEAWRFYAGTGIAAHFISTEVDAPQFGLNDANDSLTKGGMTLLTRRVVRQPREPRQLHRGQGALRGRLPPAEDQLRPELEQLTAPD
jgi:hypothetical protein